ncbi:MAG: hypothetical protein JWN50_489 [Parcubacteria group bacterium]|nr:hypothetical protein [Parcubacteria group bacterium]
MSAPTSRGSLKVELVGRGLVTLRPSDHVATGGEGSIYRVGKDTVAKIFTDPKKVIPAKIRELGKLKSPYVIAPKGLIVSEKCDPVGYYMPYIDEAECAPLSRVFTNDFWNREGFNEKFAKELVIRMRDTVSFAHGHGAILVDANELNWFMKFRGSNPEPRVVDVDSWAIGRWPATAIMPSIRDWNAKGFDEKSDWFSWGVVTFQVFTGVHPYKGTHPSYKKTEFLERMKANASVFAPNVRLNQAVRDFSLIPKGLLAWYEAVFQKGERNMPPSNFDIATASSAARVLRIQTIGKSGLLVFEKLYERTNDAVVRTFRSGAALLASGLLVDVHTKQEIAKAVGRECEVARTPDGWLILEKENGQAKLTYAEMGSQKAEWLAFSIEAKSILGYENRLFVLGERGLTEIKLHSFGTKVLASAGQTWSTLPNATQCFDGLGIQDAMGAKFLLLPFGDSGLMHVRVRELDGKRVLRGKAGNRFASVIAADKSGSYQRIDLVFSKDYGTYRSDVTAVDDTELDIAILPKGVNASIEDDGELCISVPSSGVATKLEDKHVSTKMILGNFGDQVVYIENGSLWSVRMK